MIKEYELVIVNRATKEHQAPPVLEGVQWETERVGAPGKLTFTVVKTEGLSFHEGDIVQFAMADKPKVNGKLVPDFHGYIFSKHRNKDHHIEVVAYDQIRFLKNKNTYVMENVRADQVLKRIADDFNLKTRDLPNTGFVIEKFVQSNQTLLDMIQYALDLTVTATGRLFCLYDDAGYLSLREMAKEHTGLVFSDETAEDFDYTSSIDHDTYNQIVVIDTEKKSGNPIIVEQDLKNQKQWGILTNYVEASGIANPQEYARNLLKFHNRVSRSLELTGQIGNMKVRAGTRVRLMLYLGDKNVNWDMVVDKATHVFNHGHHKMDLKLIGHSEWYD